LSLPEAGRFFPEAKRALLGNPIRRAIREGLARAAAAGGSSGALSILILGGSQGAAALNALVPEALAGVGRPLSVVHQTGAKDEAKVREAYLARGLTAHVAAFFDDMAARYGAADLVICRAGATTIAELGVVGRPAILVPFPEAADNHQEINARSLVDAGAALLFRQAELTPGALADAVRALAEDPARRAAMSEAAKRLGRPDAARDVAEACIELVGSRR
jgi:UDP-N-acetylglucosamine--N-acetylmuramyl-(pentapeptide) pyrophosphoryl-undecaprenol N-acetylglucosamine transferase